jgi:hypothetical protein
MPQPLEKSQLYQMWKKEKGSFGTKAGVMTFIPGTKTVNVLSSDEKIPEAVFIQFKADKGGDDQGFETKTFAEDGAKGYFKNFSITDVNEAKIKALKENIMREMTIQNPTYEHFQVGARVKKKDNSLVGEITEWDGDTATIKTDEGEIHHVQGNVLTKGDIPTKEDTPNVNPKAHVPEDVEKVEESKEERDSKLKSLKEKLMKVVREVAKVTDDKGTVVALKANAADAQEFVQGQEPAVKSKLKVTA